MMKVCFLCLINKRKVDELMWNLKIVYLMVFEKIMILNYDIIFI
jgi:hypothetical protein